MTAKVTTSDLARIISDAALFALRGTDIPVLNAIRLESSEKNLTAVASDRFTIGASSAQYLDGVAGEHFNISLELRQVQLLAKLAKSSRQAFSDVSITVDGSTATFVFSSGESLSLPTPLSDHKFPDWRKLVRGYSTHEGQAADMLALNPQYVSKFGRVHDARKMLIKLGAPGHASLVSIGDQFVGAIMPIRLKEGQSEWSFPQWIDRPEPKPAAPKRPRRTRKVA